MIAPLLRRSLPLALAALALFSPMQKADAQVTTPPPGFTALFNGKDLAGWFGWGTRDPRDLLAMSPEELAEYKKQSLEGGPLVNKKSEEHVKAHWKVEGGELVNDGKGLYLTTDNEYGNFELLVDYKMLPLGDSGIYLRGVPQVQIWDSNETDEKAVKLGKPKGSGGLWNNEASSPGRDPLVKADKPLGEWNRFRIVMVGSRVSVWLNDQLVVDHAILENYFDKKKPADQRQPILAKAPIQLQTHGSEIRWRNVFIREIGSDEANTILSNLSHKGAEGFTPLFNGKNLDGWQGAVDNYEVVDGAIVCKTGKGGNLLTKEEYGDFVARVQFKLPPGGNNGLAIRCPLEGNTAYAGMTEIQVLDDNYEKVKGKLDPRQVHGSAYGMVAAARGYQHPIGEWNFQEVTVKGSTIKVELNGTVILDTDLSKVDMTTVMGGKDGPSPHPGKERTSGFFGFAGHSDPVAFRSVLIKKL